MENSREKFKKVFPDKHSLIVALHSKNLEHALQGAKIAIDNGAHGVALVTHVLHPEMGIEIAKRIKEIYPYHKVLLNILQWDPYNFRDKNLQRDPRHVMQSIQETDIDGIRADKAMIKGVDQIANNEEKYANYADDTLQWQQEHGWDKLYFGGVDFKGQTDLLPEEYPFAIEQAKKYLDVITTSGSATGISADVEKVRKIKGLAGSHPVGLASGVSIENIQDYIKNVDISIVSTKISNDYRNLNPEKVAELANIIATYNNKSIERKDFEAKTLEKYKMQSANDLYLYFQTGEVINIGMHPEHNEAQKKLSNLYPSPFTLDRESYESVEAFRMSIKYPEDDPRRQEIRKLSEMAAKSAGKEVQNIKTLSYQGKEIVVGSDKHHQLLKRALRAKLAQNPDILQILLDTGDKKLDHIVFTRHKDGKHILHDSKTIPGEKFAQLYTELRDEFKYQKDVYYQITNLFI